MRRLVCLLALMLCLIALPAAAEGVNRALLIGCDRFLSAEDTSPSSANNVQQMAAVLAGQGLKALSTRGSGVSGRAEMARLIQLAFVGAKKEDTAWFYISTHGVWEQGMSNGDFTLLLSDGVREEGITATELKSLFDRVPGRKVFIIDACHSGAMIGKGVTGSFENIFAGEEYLVICSSGGEEDSWFWAGPRSGGGSAMQVAGQGYFSGALVSGLTQSGGFCADANRDGAITLTEIRRWLRRNHGASSVQTYPEESDIPLLTYSTAATARTYLTTPITGISFEVGALSPEDSEILLSFTVVHAVRVAYQVVYQRGGSWDFAHARLQYDTSERFGDYGDALGWLTPGHKERSVLLSAGEAERESGYALLQLLIIDGEDVSVAASRVLCVSPEAGDPSLAIECGDSFRPGAGGELTAAVFHSVPCELSVWVEEENGEVVRRLMASEPTRPEQLSPEGTTVVWNGLGTDGTPAAPGTYRLHARTVIGGVQWETWSAPFALE